MLEIGKRQTLYIDHKTGFGVYLSRGGEVKSRLDTVLLPKNEVPEGADLGDPVEVFVYRDSEDRMIATTHFPEISLEQPAVLEVAEINEIGAFLKWGLPKDLFLPYGEQTVKVRKGDRYLIALYIDKSNRLCGTMKVYDALKPAGPYIAGDHVKGIVYGKNPRLGVFVAVDGKYHAMIPKRELVRDLRIGDLVEARVMERREDGKLNLSLREKGHIQMDVDAKQIMDKLQAYEGYLPYHDKSSPEEIREEFHMSKNEFKRAIGRLYKLRKIEITSEGIRLL